MALGELISLANEIEAMPLSDKDKERLMVQAADLVRFKEAFPEPVEIVQPFENRGVVLSGLGYTVSVLFCEHHCRKDESLEMPGPAALPDGQQLWLVFITFSGKECCGKIARQAASHPLRARCDRAYVLDYSTGSLNVI
ncbi:hypothetical protein [uncultured Flavobacterium sp.]|uniref:hypothetical protein n=1 Tax=uncultured Flavobacterium sp. TaxID=165435 RepID=UPI0025E9C44D|nr:hypothetical protein [uncultured Flavobacterium sp.]